MNVKIQKNKVIVTHTLKRSETYKISNNSKFSSIHFFKKPYVVKGVSSRCEDGKHVLFIDYDNVPLWIVKDDINIISKEYNLPPVFLFTTGESKDANGIQIGNYHVICVKKFFPKEIYEIISKTHADVNFMSMPLRNKYRNWILRLSPKIHKKKPKFIELYEVGIISEKEIKKIECSKAHINLLRKIYPEIMNLELNWRDDNLDTIFLQDYETS